MIKRIIALFSTICMAAAVSGCSSAENSNGGEYECGGFRFTISGKYNEDMSASSKTLYEFSNGSSKIDIHSTVIFFDDMKTYLELDADTAGFRNSSDEEVNIVSTDIVTDLDCEYSAGAIHFELDNGMGSSSYYIENETRALSIKTEYKLSKKNSVCKDVEKLIASVEYISDFKLPMEDTKIDNEYLSATVPKEWSCEYGGEEKGNIYLYYSLFNKIQVNSAEELYTSIDLKVTEKSKSSPEENADDIAEFYVGSGNETSRFEYEMFGIETECAEVIFSDKTERICYFEHNGYSWYVTLIYANDAELADIEDMLSRIELK